MDTMDLNKKNTQCPSADEPAEVNEMTNLQEDGSIMADGEENTAIVTDEHQELENKYRELNDAHLRLMAEFDNYRKRTLREKADLIRSGGEGTLLNLLPIVDDFERALQHIGQAEDVSAVKEGVELIYNKFLSFLSQQGVKPVEAVGQPFDTNRFEAVATVPAQEPALKGKVIESVQTGYLLYDKVIRYAKVVVAE